MAYLVSPNIIVCPHCNKEFEYNRVNGIALLQLIADIEARKRMYTRLALEDIERLVEHDELKFPAIRKIVLDSMNDFTRAISTELGFGTEAE